MLFEIHENFVKLYRQFADVQYSILIPEDVGFSDDWSRFQANVS